MQWGFSHNLGEPEKGEAVGFSSHEFKSPEIPTGYRAKSVSYDVRCSTATPRRRAQRTRLPCQCTSLTRAFSPRNLNEYSGGGGQSNQNWAATGTKNMKGEQGSVTVAVAGFSSLALSLGGTLTITAELTTEAFRKMAGKNLQHDHGRIYPQARCL